MAGGGEDCIEKVILELSHEGLKNIYEVRGHIKQCNCCRDTKMWQIRAVLWEGSEMQKWK